MKGTTTDGLPSASITAPNVSSLVFAEEQGSYLVGVAAVGRLRGGDLQQQGSGLVIGDGVEMVDEVARQGEFMGVGPFLGELGDVLPVGIGIEFPEDQLGDGLGGLQGGQPLERLLELGVVVDLADVADAEFFPLGGHVEADVGVGLSEADESGGEFAGLSGFESGVGESGGGDGSHAAAHATHATAHSATHATAHATHATAHTAHAHHEAGHVPGVAFDEGHDQAAEHHHAHPGGHHTAAHHSATHASTHAAHTAHTAAHATHTTHTAAHTAHTAAHTTHHAAHLSGGTLSDQTRGQDDVEGLVGFVFDGHGHPAVTAAFSVHGDESLVHGVDEADRGDVMVDRIGAGHVFGLCRGI